MSSFNATASNQGQPGKDSKQVPGMPHQNDHDRKEAETKEGKPQDGGKPEQK